MSAAQGSEPSARSLFKSILQGSSLYSIAQVLPTATSLILVPVTTRFLTRADYGIQDLLSQVAIVLAALTGWYFSVALGYFYFQADPADRHRVVGTSVLGTTMLGLAACAICYPLAGTFSTAIFPHIPATAYLRLMFLLMPLSFASDSLLTWLRVVDRPGTYVAISALRAITTIVCTIWFVGILKLHIWGVLYSTTASLLLSTIVLGVLWLLSQRPAFDPALFVRIAKYAIPLGLSGIAMFIVHFGDSFILPHFRPYDDLGIYRLAYKIAMMISMIYGAFATYWGAQVFQVMRREDADTVFARLFTYVMLGISFCSLGIVVCARPALGKLAGPAFQDAWVLVPVLVAAYFVRCISEFMRSLFLAVGRPSLDAATTWIGAAVCLGGYAALIPKFGVWGAAYATLIAFGALAVVATVWTYRLRPYRVEGGRLAKIAVALGMSIAVWLLFRGWQSFGGLLLAATVALATFPAVLWVLRFPTPGELTLAYETFRRAVARKR